MVVSGDCFRLPLILITTAAAIGPEPSHHHLPVACSISRAGAGGRQVRRGSVEITPPLSRGKLRATDHFH